MLGFAKIFSDKGQKLAVVVGTIIIGVCMRYVLLEIINSSGN